MYSIIYLDLLTTSTKDSLTILKNLKKKRPNILTIIKQMTKSALKIVSEMAENIIAKILSDRFFK